MQHGKRGGRTTLAKEQANFFFFFHELLFSLFSSVVLFISQTSLPAQHRTQAYTGLGVTATWADGNI